MLKSRNTLQMQDNDGLVDFADDDASIMRKSKAKNIAKTMGHIINWFSAYKRASSLDDEEDVSLSELGGRRFVTISICLPQSVMS